MMVVMFAHAGCGKVPQDSGGAAAIDPNAPIKYASPWDRPLAGKGPHIDSRAGGQQIRSKTYDELLRGAGGDVSLDNLAVASPFQVGDDLPNAPRRDDNLALINQDGDSVQREKVKKQADGLEVSKDAKQSLAVGPGQGWSIVLFTFSRETGAEQATQALSLVREAGIGNAKLEDRGPAIVITFGTYVSADSKSAKDDLARIKSIRVGETLPFSGAVLSPPVYSALPGTIPEYDLRNVVAQYGKDALYTLQIGVYCRIDEEEPTAKELGEFRAAAERAVVDLRRQGETAFYYHGPRRSSVTVGVFFDKDYNVRDPRAQSPVLSGLRQKFPYNLTNGAGVQRTRSGATGSVMDASFVVNIPR